MYNKCVRCWSVTVLSEVPRCVTLRVRIASTPSALVTISRVCVFALILKTRTFCDNLQLRQLREVVNQSFANAVRRIFRAGLSFTFAKGNTAMERIPAKINVRFIASITVVRVNEVGDCCDCCCRDEYSRHDKRNTFVPIDVIAIILCARCRVKVICCAMHRFSCRAAVAYRFRCIKFCILFSAPRCR